MPERQRALTIYRKAWEANPQNADALRRARALCRELGHLDEMVSILEQELLLEKSSTERVRLALLSAEALLDLGDGARAAGVLMGAAALAFDSPELQDALSTAGHDDEWRTEVRRLVELAAHAPPVEAARMCLRAARILGMEDPDDPEREGILRRVLSHDPRNESAMYLLETLLIDGGRREDLVALQQDRLQSAPKADRAELCLRYAMAWSERFRDRQQAATWCTQAVAQGKLTHPIAAITILRDAYGGARQWEKLLDAVDQVLGLKLDPEAEVHAALLGGTVAWKAVKDLDRASTYFERVKKLAPRSALQEQFEDFVEQAHKPEELGEAQRALMDTARKTPTSDSPDRAIEIWKRAIAVDMTKRSPRRALALLLRRNERWRALAEALKDEEAHACRTDEERVAVLMDLVMIYRERLKHDHLVASTLDRVLELKPGNLNALDQLTEHYQSMRRWAEVVATLERKGALVVEPKARVALHLRVAKLYRENLGNEPAAIKEMESALALDGDLRETEAELLAAYEKRREWEKLITLSRRGLPRLSGPDRLTAQVQLARLASEKIKRPAVSVEAWSEVLALEPDHTEALAALEKLYGREQDWPRLAEIYARQAERAKDAPERAACLQKLALLASSSLRDPERAIGAWRQLLEIAPANLRAQDALKRLYVGERAWGELEAFFRRQGKLDECVRLFERQLAEEDDATRVVLNERIALLYRDALRKPESALKAFERVLSLEPRRETALRAVIPYYEQSGESAKLASALALDLDHLIDPVERQERLERLARLSEKQLGDDGAAFDWWLRAFEENEHAEAARGGLERLADKTGRHAALVAAYQKAAAAMDPPRDALPLLTVVARAEEQRLGNVDAALVTWRRILAEDERNGEAIDVLERLYLGMQRYDELQAIYTRKLALLGDDVLGTRQVQYKIARLAEEKGDLVRAVAAYQAILAAGGDARPELEALDRIFRRQEAWKPLDDVLERQLSLVEHQGDLAAMLAVQFRLAEVREAHLNDVPRAIDLYGQILGRSPAHAGARAGLEKRLDEPAYARRAATLLDPVFAAGNEYESLARVREVMVPYAGGAAEQVAMLTGLASLYEQHLQRPSSAFDAMARALRIDPSSEAVFDGLERLARQINAWPQLAAVFKEIAGRPLPLAEQVNLRCRLGRLYMDELGEIDRAVATFSRVLDLDGGNRRAHAALAALYERTQRYGDLAALYRREAEGALEPAELIAVEFRLGRVYEQHLGDLTSAMGVYRQILQRDPAHRPTLETLERLLDVLTDPKERLAVHLGLAATHERSFGDLARAEASYRRVLEIEPAQPEALAALDRLLDKPGRGAELAVILRRRLEAAGLAEERVELARRLARLEADVLHDPGRAADLYEQLLQDAPEDEDAVARLETILVGQRAWERLYALHERLAGRVSSDERRARHRTRLARLAEGPIGDPVRAVAEWNQVLSLAGDRDEPLDALAALYVAADEIRELAAVLERKLSLVAVEDAKLALLRRLGRLYAGSLADPTRAITAWQRARELDPEELEVLRGLAAAFTATERFAELATTLEQLLALRKLPADDERATWARLGKLEAEVLGRGDRAEAAFRRLLGLDPSSVAALSGLEACYAAAGRWREHIDILEQRAELEPAERVELLLRAAATWEAKVGDPVQAAAAYARVSAVEPDNAVASAQLEAIHRMQGDWARLASVLSERATRASDAPSRVALYEEVAQLREDKLKDDAGAFALLLQAFAIDQRYEAFAPSLQRLADATGRWDELLEILRHQAEGEPDPARRVTLHLDRAALLELHSGEPDAIVAYEAALAIDRTAPRALANLERLYRRTRKLGPLLDLIAGRVELSTDDDERLRLGGELAQLASEAKAWPRAIRALERLSELEPSPQKRGKHLYAAGVIARDELGDADEALRLFNQALDCYALDPARLGEAACLQAIEAIDRVIATRGDWRTLESSYRRLIERIPSRPGSPLLIKLWQDLGALYRSRLADDLAAERAYAQAASLEAGRE